VWSHGGEEAKKGGLFGWRARKYPNPFDGTIGLPADGGRLGKKEVKRVS